MNSKQKTWGSRFLRASRQFIKFGIVGGSGTLVNLAVAALSKKIAGWTVGIHESDAFMNLLGSSFHIRWYHVFMTIAFLVANTWNYQLNRMWTFKTATIVSWWKGFFPFLATGLVAFIASQVVATLLMNETSPIALSSELFDDSTGFRTKFYWALVISIFVSMPVNFIVNKYWTFKKPKTRVVLESDPV
ncbi:GtrA-like protein [Corynebacterium suranareeae]|uniref:GtrA-like protein n=1 Tax=Corynebacterium suranareeae TaxID=2506452 RepID=A0A160PPX8_9CORY|nr:GtrA family protein [Corynebacterium suranareeae]BAU95485.1 GtrA-like protein [Corynebacterium suranareeae]